MRTFVSREIPVYHCDECGKEASVVNVCSLCFRDLCNADGGKKHFAFSGEIYSYDRHSRNPSFNVCRQCAEVEAPSPLGKFFSDVVGKIFPYADHIPGREFFTGDEVITLTANELLRRGWTSQAWEARQWGVVGMILNAHDSHGLCY